MNNLESIKKLRELTGAGMALCKSSLEEASGDIQAAIDIIKVKGQNIVSGRQDKVATEGVVEALTTINSSTRPNIHVLAEVNCNTDFCAKSPEFTKFVRLVLSEATSSYAMEEKELLTERVESARQELIASTKENIVIRRLHVEEDTFANTVFQYVHSNSRIAVLLTLRAPSVEVKNNPKFKTLGEDLAMQVAAMNPLAVSFDKLPEELVTRQKAIFETQLTELKKPQAAWPKIMDGKLNKWSSEVCLLNQTSVVHDKLTIRQVIDQVDPSIRVTKFTRFELGEGLTSLKSNFAEEVAKMQ